MPREKTIERLLRHVLHITEGTPYTGAIIDEVSKEEIPGEVIFHTNNNNLHFDFYLHKTLVGFADLDAVKMVSESWQDVPKILSIPSRVFKHPVYLRSMPHSGMLVSGSPNDRQVIRGRISVKDLGSPIESLNSAFIRVCHLPSNWFVEDLYYVYRTVKDIETVTPKNLYWQKLSALTLNADGWRIYLDENYDLDSFDDSGTHTISIVRDDGSMFTGLGLYELLEDYLYPFLSFVFGQHIQFTIGMGLNRQKFPRERWGILFGHSLDAARNPSNNWFLRVSGDVELNQLYRSYCEIPDERRKQLARIINFYATSEEIISTLGQIEAAYSISFSALEGLTKLIISSYSDSDEWLNNNLRLKRKRGKTGNLEGIADAVEFVVRRELGSTRLESSILDSLKNIRNDTVHMNLNADELDSDIYYRWNSVQTLIEMILLAHLGMKRIPNRTIPGKFDVLGKDVLAKLRSESLEL